MQTLEAFVVRPATPDDAEELLRLRLALDEESSFMLFEPGERLRSPERKIPPQQALGGVEHRRPRRSRRAWHRATASRRSGGLVPERRGKSSRAHGDGSQRTRTPVV